MTIFEWAAILTAALLLMALGLLFIARCCRDVLHDARRPYAKVPVQKDWWRL